MQKKNFSHLLEQNQSHHNIVESMLNGYAVNEIILDYKHEPIDYMFLDVNSAFEDITGLDRKEVIGKSILDIMPLTKIDWIRLCGDVALNLKDVCTEYYSPILKKHFHVRIKSEEKGKFYTVFNDITAFKEANQKIQEQKEEFESIFKNINVGLIRTDINDGKIINANPVCAKIFGFDSLEDFMKISMIDLYKDPNDRKIHRAKLLRNGKLKRTVLQMKKANNKTVSLLISSTLNYVNNLPTWVDSTIQDISKQLNDEDKLYHLAHYDTLTQLSNRYAFMDKLKESIASSSRNKQKCAVFFLDLDGFKEINDTYGHTAGDIVLKETAMRLKNVVRQTDMVARIGGDEFTIIIENVTDIRSLNILAKKIVQTVCEKIEIDKNFLSVTTSLGVSMYPDDAANQTEILNHADNAMYRAKELGKNTIQFFTKDLNIDLINKTIFETALRNSIKDEELQLFYQARKDLKTNEIVSFETVLRWNNKAYGWVSPEDFLPVANQSDFINDIFLWLLEKSCKDIKLLQDKYLQEFSLSVNIPKKSINDKSFIKNIKKALKNSGLNPSCLQVLIQQDYLMHEIFLKHLKVLKSLNIKVIIENFGTGISSFADLENIEIDALKIDKSFIEDLNKKAPSKTLKFLSYISKTCDIDLIAQEVQSELQLTILKDLGVSHAQGFHIFKCSSLKDTNLLLDKEFML